MSDVGRYRKIFPRLFRHPGFQALKQSTQLLVIYLLAGPQTNGIGLFFLSIATASEDLKLSVETIRKGLADVAVTFDWRFDADARVFYIPSWWRWNRPENRYVLSGNLKALSEIPPCSLVEAFAKNTKWLPSEPDKDGKTSIETFAECLRIRLPKRPRVQDQEHLSGAFQEQEQEGAATNGETTLSAAHLSIAKEVLKLTNPDGPLDELVDTFGAVANLRNTKWTKASAIAAIQHEQFASR
jgi:hypothetical protein